MRHLACAALLTFLPCLAAGQEKTVPTPPNVKVEGMPPIPQSILDGVARYGQFHSAEMQAWHPTKRQIVIRTALGTIGAGNPPQLHYVESPGRDRRQLTWYTTGVHLEVSPAFDPTDPNMLVFQYDPGGNEARSLYRYDMGSGSISLVVESKTRYAHVWARQGKWLAYDSSERNGRDRDLYVIQPSDPTTKRLVATVEGAWSPEDWSPDGSSILMTEIFGNSETYLWRVDVKTGEKTPITKRGDGDKASWYNARFSADGKKVYAISDRGHGGEFRIWRCDVARCAWSPVSADGLTVSLDPGANFEISPDGTMLAMILDRGTSTELHVIDLTTLKSRPLPTLPRGIVSQIHWRPGSRELGFTFGSIKAQGDVYSIDASLGTLTRWTFSETTFNPEVLPAPEVVQWKSFDGQAISGVLYRPSTRFTGARPVLVSIHGGPDDKSRAIFRGRSNYLLNELGVAIIYPNVRGSMGFGRAFQDLDNGRGRDSAIKDIGAVLDWIGTRPEFDKDRVVLIGVSYGGWLALEAGIVYNDRIRGIIEGAGMTDLVTFLDQTAPERQENRRQEYGDERDPQMREYLKSISPITRASDLKKPTLILHPGKDARVPVSQAQELAKALKANNATVWYVEFTEANHDNLPVVGGNYLLSTWMWFFKNFVLN
jgi:dipeptidyl aminopeptidase/acylaminoacyl peptidase